MAQILFTYADLVSFGNDLLEHKNRKKEATKNVVTDADLRNWEERENILSDAKG